MTWTVTGMWLCTRRRWADLIADMLADGEPICAAFVEMLAGIPDHDRRLPDA